MSKIGHIPIRTCIGCRKKRKKEEMVWFIQSPDGSVSIHEKKNQRGRGFYLCPDGVCFEKAYQRKRKGSIPVMGQYAVSSDSMVYQWTKGLPWGRNLNDKN